MLAFLLSYLLLAVAKVTPVLLAVAFFTLVERKIMSGIQRRKGPNVVGIWGALQAFADALKLMLKEVILPVRANKLLLLFSPFLSFVVSLSAWVAIPTPECSIADFSLGILFLLAMSSLNVYGIILAGWSSYSQYAFLGALRAAAQMIGYEVSLSFTLLPVIVLVGTLSLRQIVYAQVSGWFFQILFPLVIVFFISMLAETNRAPFDLAEAESELVAGFMIEYSSILFAIIFLTEYNNMLLMSNLFVIIFFGGWLPIIFSSFFALFYSVKVGIICFFYVLVRAILPRYRYDQLMDLGWKWLLPFVLGYFLFIFGILYLFNGFPVNIYPFFIFQSNSLLWFL